MRLDRINCDSILEIERNRLSPLRRRGPKTCAISAPQTSRTAGISTHPCAERMLFLGSRLVGSDLCAWPGLWTRESSLYAEGQRVKTVCLRSANVLESMQLRP